jgi:hypothetical protein
VNPGLILRTFGEHQVDCLLIGGMNFLLRHQPVTTFDIDFWIADEAENRARVARALSRLGAESERMDGSWGRVSTEEDWLVRQPVHCLTSPAGAIDIFRFVHGLDSYEGCKSRAVVCKNEESTEYRCLCDEDMLQCQLALPEGQRRVDRIAQLRKALGS